MRQGSFAGLRVDQGQGMQRRIDRDRAMVGGTNAIGLGLVGVSLELACLGCGKEKDLALLTSLVDGGKGPLLMTLGAAVLSL